MKKRMYYSSIMTWIYHKSPNCFFFLSLLKMWDREGAYYKIHSMRTHNANELKPHTNFASRICDFLCSILTLSWCFSTVNKIKRKKKEENKKHAMPSIFSQIETNARTRDYNTKSAVTMIIYVTNWISNNQTQITCRNRRGGGGTRTWFSKKKKKTKHTQKKPKSCFG